MAILIALQWVEKIGQEKVLICSDSLSVLASLRSFHSKARQDILYEVLQVNTRLSHMGCQVKFMWVPAHVGITGNEMADRLAKRALTKENVEVQVNVSKAEVKCIIWGKINKTWQYRWDREEKGRHLYQIQRNVKEDRVGRGNRREEAVMTRLRLGHFSLNKTLKMIGKHQTGLCEGCREEESVEHIIMTCKRYETQRQVMKYKLREIGVHEITLKGLLSTVNRIQSRILMSFLREAGVFNRI